ncbi:hypothetical protein C0580_03010 [Candidatus Parcubacteria bacterium]|nr:MAG: hypothetical protein C0580_03010 [Candidatus Parcubacteria bacterium]
MKTKKTLFLASLMIVAVFLLTGCSKGRVEKFQKPDIKDDFCGISMPYQYCKCAFHNEYCEDVSLSSSAANSYVREEYDKWVKGQLETFETTCNSGGGIYSNKKCTYCEDPYYKEGNKCVKAEDKENDDDSSDQETSFVADGPFNSDCSINESSFENEWKKYSDFDDNIDFNARSWEVQQNLNTYEQIMELKAQNFVLQRDMEIDRQLRLTMREYKAALVQNIKTNLLKSFWRLSYVTYSTIKSGKGIGESYSKVLTSGKTLEVISQGLKVVQGVIPADSSLAVDTSTVSGKVKSIGLNAALETLDSMGDPVKVATQVFNDASNAALPSADITPEEIEILRTQHLSNQAIDQALKASYKANAERRKQLLANENQIKLLEAQAASWQYKEKSRVRAMLESDCQRQRDDWEDKQSSSLFFINTAFAQENDDQQNIQADMEVDTLQLGDYTFDYDEKETNEDSIDYYITNESNKILVLSSYDTDDNDTDDMWLVFSDDLYITMEVYDTDNDGEPDTFVELDKDEQVTNLIQPELSIPEYQAESDLLDSENSDYSNDDESSIPIWVYIVLIVILGGLILFKKRK